MKLQIHQHSLLTRKVFSRHNLLAWVFFFVSSGSSSIYLHLQVILIIGFGSSLDIEHHWIWIISGSSSLDLDHHWNWITIRSESSLDHHHWIWIITRSGSSLLDHHWVIITGAISQFYSSQEVLQSQPFFMLVVGLASM